MTRFYWMTLPVVLGSATFVSLENAPAPAGWLQASVDTFRLTLVTGGAEQPIGQLIDALEVVEDQGRMVYRRIRQYQNERMFGDREATVVDRFPDVRPISHSVVDRWQVFELAYSDTEVRATGFDRLGALDIREAIEAPLVNVASVDLLLRGAQLHSRFVVEYTVWRPRLGLMRLTATVDGTEVVRLGAEIEIAWRVRMVSERSLTTTLWIGQESREILRQEITLGPNRVLVFSR